MSFIRLLLEVLYLYNEWIVGRKREIRNILLMHAVSMGFASSLVIIFIPVYLLTLGYSLIDVMKFLMVHHMMILVSSFFVVFVSNKIGLIRILWLRFGFLFLYLFFLYSLHIQSNISIYIISIIGGIEAAFYWIPLNILFTRFAERKTMAKQVSNLFVLPGVAGIPGPFIGGVIAAFLGFPALFIFVFLVNIFALWFLRGLNGERTSFQFSIHKFKEIYTRNKTYFLSEFFDNIAEETILIIFPIASYLILLSVIDVGLIGTLISLGMMVFTLVIGRFADRYDKKKMMRIGTALLVGTLIFGFFTQSSIGLYIVSVLLGFSLRFFLVPYSALLFTNAKKDDAQFLVLREISVVAGRVFVFIFAILFASILEITFLITALMLLYFFTFNPSLHKKNIKL